LTVTRIRSAPGPRVGWRAAQGWIWRLIALSTLALAAALKVAAP
jgi:hypothetical protein